VLDTLRHVVAISATVPRQLTNSAVTDNCWKSRLEGPPTGPAVSAMLAVSLVRGARQPGSRRFPRGAGNPAGAEHVTNAPMPGREASPKPQSEAVTIQRAPKASAPIVAIRKNPTQRIAGTLVSRASWSASELVAAPPRRWV